MRKRLRSGTFICSCKSPRLNYQESPCVSFNRFEEDVWTEVAKHLDGKSLVKLAATCSWFHHVMMHDSIWRYACLRDLQVPAPHHVSFKWIKLYGSLADGSHTYSSRDSKKHIDWMRIGGFFFDSKVAFITDSLSLPLKISRQDSVENMLESCGTCVLGNIKTGVWVADLQLVRCPVCELETCEGTMQTLDARHVELLLCEGYQDGSWQYELIGSHALKSKVAAATGAIFDVKHLKDRPMAGVFNLKSWAGKPDDLQPKAMITFHSVAISTNLQENQEGLLTKYYVMKSGQMERLFQSESLSNLCNHRSKPASNELKFYILPSNAVIQRHHSRIKSNIFFLFC